MKKTVHLLRMAQGSMLVVLLMVLLSAVPASALAEDEIQAYARYANKTLTFYYDDNKKDADTDFSLNSADEAPAWSNSYAQEVNEVVFDESFKSYPPTSCRQWFAGMKNLESIEGIENLNTEKVETMNQMFYDCSSLTTLDLSTFNTAKVTDMTEMFQDCSALTTIIVSKSFTTTAVTVSTKMFSGCTSLKGAVSYDANNDNDANYASYDKGYLTLYVGPYVRYADNTLTFYYGSDRQSSDYTLELVGKMYPQWTYEMVALELEDIDVTKVVFDKSFSEARPTTTDFWFWGMENLESIEGLEYLNTSDVTSMMGMFADCKKLTSLNLSTFDVYKVTTMQGMFYQCKGLVSVDCSNLNAASLTSMMMMFGECVSLTSVNFSGFNSSKVTDMSDMFYSCSNLTTLDLSSLNTAAVTNMKGMFYGCASLTTVNFSNINTTAVTTMKGMFAFCSALTTIDLSNFNTAAVTNMEEMFINCPYLTTIYVSKDFTTKSVTASDNMFYGCTALKGAISYDANNNNDANYANYDKGYLTLYVGPYVRIEDKTLTFYYGSDKQSGDYTLDVVDVGDAIFPKWVYELLLEEESIGITKVVFDKSFSEARPTTTSFWFMGFDHLESIEGLEYLNTSEVTSMEGMFAYCAKLTNLNLSTFDVSKVTTMKGMFYQCQALVSVDCSNFNTPVLENMGMMFEECPLTSIDLSSFNTANVTDMIQLFSVCSNLTTIYVSKDFTTENVTESRNMFYGCTALKGAISYDADKTKVDYANYATGYFTKKVGTYGDDILGAAGSPLAIEKLAIDDSKTIALCDDEDVQATSASYSRSMTSKWGTLCLPFAVDATSTDNTCKFYSLQTVGTESVVLTPIESGTIEAGTPVAICKKDDSQTEVSIKATNAKVVGEPVNETSGSRLVGTFAGEVLHAGGYFIAKDRFFSVDDYGKQGVKVNPYRAYIMADSGSNQSAMLSIMVDDDVTGIDTLDVTAAQNTTASEYYDANGRRTQGLQHGLNIVKKGNKTLKVMIK